MITPSPAKVWVVVAQHRSSSILPFTVAATRRAAWQQYLATVCGTGDDEGTQRHLAYVNQARAAGLLRVAKAIIEVTR